ncbi:MAG TPA: citrate (Si)-synthase, partial [Rhodanobacteraceae bacterium]|nr:citrate (Si)-synthase [Rhodanobacteraceae bacterium]
MSDKSVKLIDAAADRSTELPLVSGSMGPACVDLASLFKDTGHFTYDPGFASTAST